MNETEKSKRNEKPKGAPRRRWLFASMIVTLIVLAAGMFGLFVLPACACSPIEETATSISATNAEIALLLAQTEIASLMLTLGPPPEYWWTETAEVKATGTAYLERSLTATRIADSTLTAGPPMDYYQTQTAVVKATRTAELNQLYTATMQAEQTAIALLTDVTDGGGPAMMTPDASMTPSPQPGLTATKMCFWNWAYQDDAEFAQRIATVLDEAGIEVVSLTVSAHGEDYICDEDGRQTKSFHPMDWSPAVSIPEIRGETPAAMGARIEAVLRAVEAMNVGGLYRIDIIFTSTGTESVLWRMDYKAALEALNSGMTGAALYEAGRGG